MVEGTNQGNGSLICYEVLVNAPPRKGSVSLSQKFVFLSITFDEQESPGDPNTIPDGHLLLIISGSYGLWLGWDGKRPWCCSMGRGLREGKGFVTSTCLGEGLAKVSWLIGVGLRLVEMQEVDYLFLDVLLIIRWCFKKYIPCARHCAKHFTSILHLTLTTILWVDTTVVLFLLMKKAKLREVKQW